jgi:hypothetical protein
VHYRCGRFCADARNRREHYFADNVGRDLRRTFFALKHAGMFIALFFRFFEFIDGRIADYRERCVDARDMCETFVRHGYCIDSVGLNSLYGLVQTNGGQQHQAQQHQKHQKHPLFQPRGAFDATVVAKYGLATGAEGNSLSRGGGETA